MADEQLLRSILKQSGLENKDILGKTQEILRKLTMKLSLGALNKAEGCRYMIAIELACNLLGLPVDTKTFVLPKSTSQKVYQEGLITCKNILQLKNESDCIVKLAVQYGSDTVSQARGIFDAYKNSQLDKSDKSCRSSVDSNTAVCQAAAFFVAANIYNKKLKLKKVDVATIAGIDILNFTSVLEAMQQMVDQSKNSGLKDKSLEQIPSSNNSASSSSSSSSNSTDNNIKNMININGKEYPNYEYGRESINKITVNSINPRDVLKQSLLDKEKQEHDDKMKVLEGVEEKRLRMREKYKRFQEQNVDSKRNRKEGVADNQIIWDSI